MLYNKVYNLKDQKEQVKVWVSEPFVIPLIIKLNNFYADDFDERSNMQ